MPPPILIQPDALRAASERIGARLIVLFGSYAPGGLTPQPDSDVDLALAFRREMPRRDWWRLYEELGEAFPGRTLDLADLADADPLFRWEIMERGVLLHGSVDDFLELRAFAYRDYVDSADLRALEQTLFEKKLAYIRGQLRAAS